LGKLGPEHLLELLGDLAPRLARASRPIRPILAILSFEPLGSLTTPECRLLRTAPAAARTTTTWRTGPAAHIGIAIDPAATATAVALAIDCRAVPGTTPSRAAAIGLPAARSAATLLAAPLLGDQVFRDLRLVEVLLVVDGRWELRGSRTRHAELRVPDGPEWRRPGCPASGRRLLERLLFLVLVLVLVDSVSRIERGRRDARLGGKAVLELATPAAAASPATATSAPPATFGVHAIVFAVAITEGRGGRGLVGLDRAGELRGRRSHPRQLLTGQDCQPTDGRHGGELRWSDDPGRPAASDDRLGLTGSAPTASATASAPSACSLGLLVRDLGHRQVLVVTGDPPAGAR
jgi:hypothetical protein